MMRHTLKCLVVLVTVALAVATPASAQQYSARQTGDIVQLNDAKTDTKVSIVPSVGNIVFEMKVKGQNILRWPYASIEEFKSRPALSGIPFLCSRIFSSVLSDDLVLRMGAVCKECGAADFIDVANLAADEARAVMQSAMKACIEGGA